MINYNELLEQYMDLKLSKQELLSLLPQTSDFYYEPIIVENSNLSYLLTCYKSGSIDEKVLLDWVNTIWFSDWYTYSDEHCDCLASIMNELEEIDEHGMVITPDRIEKYLQALERNIEI